MFQKLSNTHYNHENDTIVPETLNFITEQNFILNFNSLNQNEYKIEDTTMINDLFFVNKFPLIPKNKPNDELIKKGPKSKKEKNNNNNQLNQNRFSIIKKYNDNHTHIIFSKSHLLGRKRKDDTSARKHNKNSEDNIRIKIKNLVLKYALIFINEKIKIIYNGKIGDGINKKELYSINKDIKYDTSIENNKDFIYKTLGEIFSLDISKKYNIKFPDYNKNLIQRLLNDKDENKRLAFKKLFDIQFLKCIEVFSDNNDYEELKGFKKLKDIKENLKNEPEYMAILENYAKNYEKNIKDKKGKKLKKKYLKENEKQKEN